MTRVWGCGVSDVTWLRDQVLLLSLILNMLNRKLADFKPSAARVILTILRHPEQADRDYAVDLRIL